MIKKIGIMGGTFNPIHLAHLMLAQRALTECQLDKILFIPSGQPKYKQNDCILSKRLRLEIVGEAVKDNADFEISTIDLDRNGNTYTVDTLDELKSIEPDSELFFIMGADSLLSIEKWYRYEDVLKKCTVIAAARPGQNNDILSNKAQTLEREHDAKIIIIDMPLMDISSTEIRKRFCDGLSIRYMVPDRVLKVLKDNYEEVKAVWSR